MFGIGSAEMMIIAVVALVALGPERLPEVMRKVGQAYRQMRQMSDQLIGEARAQWEEGMREVESVSSTITDTWNQAASGAPPPGPPPRLAQVPPALEAPGTAAAAGPATLPAWYRDTKPEVEPYVPAYPVSPVALARQQPAPYDPALDGLGAPALVAPAPVEEDDSAAEEWAADVTEHDVLSIGGLYAIPEGVGEGIGANGLALNGPAAGARSPLGAPEEPPAAESRTGAGQAHTGANG